MIKRVLIMKEGLTDVEETDIYDHWEQRCIIDLLRKFILVIELDFIAPPPKCRKISAN